jgi:hypothetical protein
MKFKEIWIEYRILKMKILNYLRAKKLIKCKHPKDYWVPARPSSAPRSSKVSIYDCAVCGVRFAAETRLVMKEDEERARIS